MSLNAKQIQALKPKPDGKQYTVSDLGEAGLSILVSPKSKVFYYRYRTQTGKQKRVNLGKFPNVSLSDARDHAKSLYLSVKAGRDPLKEKRDEIRKLQARSITTVGELWDDYREMFGEAKRSADFELYLWSKYVGPEFAKDDIEDFERLRIKSYIQKVRSEKSPSLSNRIQSLLSRLGKHGFEEHDLFLANPALGLGDKPKEVSRDRYLSEAELRTFWRALNDPAVLNAATVSLLMAQALKLTALTLCRRGEIAGMQWKEVDRVAKTLTLPASRVKNKRVHIVPLSPQSLDVLDKIPEYSRKQNSHVFPSPRTDSHFFPSAVTRACTRLGRYLEIDRFTPHDLRRTGATMLTSERFGQSRFIVSRGLLNHSTEKGGASDVFGVYDQNDYLPEKREALNAWGKYLLSLH